MKVSRTIAENQVDDPSML